MMFKPESASATAVKPGVAVLVEDAAGTLLLVLRRDCALWALPGGCPAEQFDNPDALW
jgi:ADP-ribose pyrophosphatase YjhB (NUDIX family)